MLEKPKLEIPNFKHNIPSFLLTGKDELSIYIATEINVSSQRQEWIMQHLSLQHSRINEAESYIEIDKKSKMAIGVIIFGSAVTLGKVGWERIVDVWNKYIP